jgi:tetratricopeptide (TPR) repeat protein
MSASPSWLATMRIAVLVALVCFRSREACGGEPELPEPLVPTVSADRASEQLARARGIVATAESLFVAGHYEAALAEYTRAYEVLRGHPRQYWVLHNLAACNERLFRYDLALSLYEEYLSRAPVTEEDRSGVVAVTKTLRSLLGTLVVESTTPAELWVDDRLLGTAPGRWLVPNGRHLVELRAAMYEPQRFEVQLGARQTQTLRVNLQKLSTYRGPPTTYFWVATAASGVALAAGATLGVMAVRSHEEGSEINSLHLETAQHSERTRQLALAADACFGAALLFGATATVLYFVTDWSDQRKPARSGRNSRGVAQVALAPNGAARAQLAMEF